MILSSKSKYMLREAKSQAKQKEYHIQPQNYPRYRTDTRDLDYTAVYVLSKFAEAVIEHKSDEIKELYNDLKDVSQYFDAAVNIVRDFDYTYDYLLSGACAYFLSDDFGSSKALICKINEQCVYDDVDRLLYLIIQATFGTRYEPMWCCFNGSFAVKLYSSYLNYLDTGAHIDQYLNLLTDYKKSIYNELNVQDMFYIDLIYAIVDKARQNSAWCLLPKLSGLTQETWKTYLSQQKATKVLWSAQRLIGEAGIFAGRDGIIQLPTGVGKTKSIELIIRSAFLSERTNFAIVITPLRALCSEVKADLQQSFYNQAEVNQISDVFQEDYYFEIQENKKYIIVCTPEKLKYIIHHNNKFLDKIGLFIFDEGHIFDEPGRGTSYELLVTTIRSYIRMDKQFVLVSAVLANIEQMNDWLLRAQGAIVSSKNIKTTEKNIGFVSFANKQIDYFSDNNFNESSFYVTKVIKTEELEKHNRERKTRLFPEKNAKDISLYLLNKLTINGAGAIYVKQPRFVQSYITRALEVASRGYDFSDLLIHSNKEEIIRLNNLISLHYGSNSNYAKGAKLGLFPHYKNLENGVKLSVEYAIKKELIKNVICTSTLAQGVNIPIKYLFITSLDNYQRTLKARELQNLVGRTARAGMHTEGSVIITEPKLIENKQTLRGQSEWTGKIALFDPKNSEPCGSAIKLLFDNIIVFHDYLAQCDRIFAGESIFNFILDNISDADWHRKLTSQLKQAFEQSSIGEEIKNQRRESVYQNIEYEIGLRKKIVESIENHLCFLLSEQESFADFDSLVDALSIESFAFFISNDEEKEFIVKVFKAIANNVINMAANINIEEYAKSMIGLNDAQNIVKWIVANPAAFSDMETLKKAIFALYEQVFIDRKIKNIHMNILIKILDLWLTAKSFIEIQQEIYSEIKLSIEDIEKICNSSFSYNLSFLIGNIIDLSVGIDFAERHTNNLLELQKKLKYGLSCTTAISIYEIGFQDRVIAQKLATVLGEQSLTENQVKAKIKLHEKRLKETLQNYPSYFTNVLEQVLCY